MKSYKLISTKGTEYVLCESDREAIEAANEMNTRLQPAYGVSVENEAGDTIAEIE